MSHQYEGVLYPQVSWPVVLLYRHLPSISLLLLQLFPWRMASSQGHSSTHSNEPTAGSEELLRMSPMSGELEVPLLIDGGKWWIAIQGILPQELHSETCNIWALLEKTDMFRNTYKYFICCIGTPPPPFHPYKVYFFSSRPTIKIQIKIYVCTIFLNQSSTQSQLGPLNQLFF